MCVLMYKRCVCVYFDILLNSTMLEECRGSKIEKAQSDWLTDE